MKSVSQEQQLTLDQENELKLLQATNEMMQRTMEEAKLRGKDKTIKRIEIARKDVVNQIKSIDQNAETELPPLSQFEEIASRDDEGNATMDLFSMLQEDAINTPKSAPESSEAPKTALYEEVSNGAAEFNNVDSTVQYDIVPLPSHGEAYKNKIGRIPVGFLTAYDENFLTSPNLYEDGLVIDFLLKNKIVNSNVNVDEFLQGDVDAITLFLRATSYGADFPISVRDPETGEIIETVVDLSTLKPKEFNLKGDENGYFDFTLPVSKAQIKFKFLSRKEDQELALLTKMETENSKAALIERYTKTLIDVLRTDKALSALDRQKYVESLKALKEWADGLLSKKNSVGYNKLITNRLEYAVKSVNGNTDRKYIQQFIKNMPALDSYKLRKYMIDNEPGINFEIEIQRPENLGGGSFTTFLEWDNTVFLNIG